MKRRWIGQHYIKKTLIENFINVSRTMPKDFHKDLFQSNQFCEYIYDKERNRKRTKKSIFLRAIEIYKYLEINK